MMNFDELTEFIKEFKWHAKKYRSLSDDFEEFKRVLAIQPLGNSKHFNIITRNKIVSILTCVVNFYPNDRIARSSSMSVLERQPTFTT